MISVAPSGLWGFWGGDVNPGLASLRPGLQPSAPSGLLDTTMILW